jgi:hypothetical protein
VKMRLGLPVSFVNRLIVKRREEVASILLRLVQPSRGDSFLEVGGPSFGFEKASLHFGELLVLNNSRSHMRSLVSSCSHMKASFVVGDGCHLPLVDGAVDFCFSHATIEHIARQLRGIFCQETRRVCTKAYFVSTPNFRFPFEFHYLMPFFQFIPGGIRRLLRMFFSFPHVGSTEEIMLLTSNEIRALLGESSKVIGLNRSTLLGWTEH